MNMNQNSKKFCDITTTDKVITGINKTVDVVKTTMGAQGKVVIIKDQYDKPRFTKDGVTVAKSVSINDSIENIGAEIVKAAANKTVEEVGDGTTATSLLLQSLIREMTAHRHKDINEFVNQTNEAVEEVISLVKKAATPGDSIEAIRQVATISSNSKELGNLIADIYKEVGVDSLVNLELGNEDATTFEVLNGLEFNKGMYHSKFANTPQGLCVFEDCYIFAEDSNMSNISQVQSELEAALNQQSPIVIIAKSFTSEFLKSMVQNVTTVNLQACLIEMPGFGQGRIDNLEDIYSFLSSTGKVDRITIGPNYFRMFNEDTPFLESRLKELKNRQETCIDEYEEATLIKRIHNLKGSMGVIYAGGITEEAALEEYDRLEDALGSVKAAIRSGYVAGGGITLYNIASKMKLTDTKNAVSNLGREAIIDSIKEPAKQILRNANLNPDIILDKLKTGEGYDVRNHKIVKFVDNGIIDPAEVLIQALINAHSMAKLLINTSYTLNISYEKEKLF